jgi:hypothetical protein
VNARSRSKCGKKRQADEKDGASHDSLNSHTLGDNVGESLANFQR